MQDLDSTLAEDFDWALFPQEETSATPLKRWLRRLEAASVVALAWLLSPTVAVVLACLAVSFADFKAARHAARTTSDRAAARICALFGYVWGLWKVGTTAFVLIFVTIFAALPPKGQGMAPPPAAILSMVLWFVGFLASAGLTAAGLVNALRSGMRIWIGRGINQARTLLMGMLIAGFTLLVMLPAFILLPGVLPRQFGPSAGSGQALALAFGCIFGVPVAILIVLDRLSRRIVASQPGKFGPKVPSVKKGAG